METARWRFVSNGNAGYTGVNDSGIETFSSNTVCSLVREVIQNALDAQRDDTKPVKVEFSQFEIDYRDFPGHEGFSESVHACLRDNDDEDAQSFFSHAEDVIDGKYNGKIRVLRISDFNTIGLTGAETGEKGTNWSRLVKERGASNKDETSQGSFGIGKSAPFACSDLRTVFYSSMCGADKGCIESNIGVARLISFRQKNKITGKDEWTTGTGFYSDSDELLAILRLADIDKSFERSELGTDIYIMGFEGVKNFEQEIIKNVLLNFLVSIWSNVLVVKVNGQTIDKNNLQKFVNANNPHGNEDIQNLKAYYEVLTKNEPAVTVIPLKSEKYGKRFGFEDGECELRLMEGEGLNRKILMTRKSGMRIFEQDHISGTIDFTGILLMTGKNMNREFRKMEMPSHDAWKPEHIRNDKGKSTADRELKGLQKYLRGCVREKFGHTNKECLDAFGMAQYLPDSDIGDKESNLGVGKILDGNIIAIKEKHVSVSSRNVNTRLKVSSGEKDTQGHHESHDRPRKPVNSSKKKRKQNSHIIPVNVRVRARNVRAGQYMIQYVSPRNSNSAEIELRIVNEQGFASPSITIYRARIINGNASVERCENNVIRLRHVRRDDKVVIYCDLDINRYCKMEANYYYEN